jgi:uncharacterized protein (DUF302 family)
MKRLLITLLITLGMSLSLFASGGGDASKSAITTFKLSVDRDKFEEELKTKLTKEGYTYVGIHENIQSAYKKKFGTTKMAILDFVSYYNPKLFSTISKESPTVAGTFYPFTFVVHRSENDKDMYVSYLNGDFIKVLGNLKQKSVRDAIDAEYAKLEKLVSGIAGSHETKEWVGIPNKIENAIFEYKVKIPAPDKAEKLLSLLEEQLDNFIGAGGFINAGFRGINGDLKKVGDDSFNLYDEYLLCSFPISNAIFNDYPQVGAFAPCPVFIYQEKGSEYLTIGVMQMDIWTQFGPVKDCKTKKIISEGAKEVQFVLKYSAELALKKLNYEIMMEEDSDDL